MANTITTQTLVDGPRNLVIKTYLDNTGTGSEQSAAVLVNVSDFLDSVGATLTRVKIMRVEAATQGAQKSDAHWRDRIGAPARAAG